MDWEESRRRSAETEIDVSDSNTPIPDEDGQFSKEPVGGGAESVPDPSDPQTPAHDGEGDDDETGGDDTVAAKDELDGDVER